MSSPAATGRSCWIATRPRLRLALLALLPSALAPLAARTAAPRSPDYKFTETFQMPTAAACTWTDKFKPGYDPMDETHQEFVEIVNAMLSAPNADLLAHLDAFLVHGEEHFAQELAWMTETDFPSTACHADEHEPAMKSVREVRDLLVADGGSGYGQEACGRTGAVVSGHADYLDSALANGW